MLPPAVASGELRLFDHVGEGSTQADVRFGGGSSVPATRIFQLHDRLPPLGGAAEQTVPLFEVVVCPPELRHNRPAELYQAPLPLGQALRILGQKRSQVPRLQRCQGNVFLEIIFFQSDRVNFSSTCILYSNHP